MSDPKTEHDEIDVTELVERIEKLESKVSEYEKENNLKKISEIEARLIECENSIDAIAEKLGGK